MAIIASGVGLLVIDTTQLAPRYSYELPLEQIPYALIEAGGHWALSSQNMLTMVAPACPPR